MRTEKAMVANTTPADREGPEENEEDKEDDHNSGATSSSRWAR